MTTAIIRKGGREYTIEQASTPAGRGWFSTFRNVSPWDERPHGCYYPANPGFGNWVEIFEDFNSVLRLVCNHADNTLRPYA